VKIILNNNIKTSHIPTRTCIGCGVKKGKNDFIRIVKKDAQIEIDKTGKKEGRGAYICESIECFEKAYKSKKIEKNFKMKIDESVYERLKGIISGE